MAKKIGVELKELMVELSGACFWYWNSFHSYLDSAGVPRTIYQRYPKGAFNKYAAMRAILSDLEAAGKIDTIHALVSELYRLKGPIDHDQLDEKRAKQLLTQFRNLVGDDPIEDAVRKKEAEATRAAYVEALEHVRSDRERLEGLNSIFVELAGGTNHTPQERGFALERLFFDLVHLSELEHSRPYRTPTGEQVDGHFNFEKFDYLVEVKWITGPTNQEHLSIFDGKIRGKAQSTRGLFLAAEGFATRAVEKYSGDSPRILLMTGEDLSFVLSGVISFYDLLRAKIDTMVRHGRIDLAAREIVHP